MGKLFINFLASMVYKNAIDVSYACFKNLSNLTYKTMIYYIEYNNTLCYRYLKFSIILPMYYISIAMFHIMLILFSLLIMCKHVIREKYCNRRVESNRCTYYRVESDILGQVGLLYHYVTPIIATISFVFTDVTQKYTITHNSTASAILVLKQII